MDKAVLLLREGEREGEGVKMIQVHAETHRRLTQFKAVLMMQKEREVTYEDVIIDHINEGLSLKQFISHLIRIHPELKPTLEKVSKETGAYQHIETMLKYIKPFQSDAGN